MTPKQKAWLELAATTFAGGVVGYLAPLLVGGTLPPSNTWKSIALCALGAGLVALRNRLMPSPSQLDALGTRTMSPQAVAQMQSAKSEQVKP